MRDLPSPLESSVPILAKHTQQIAHGFGKLVQHGRKVFFAVHLAHLVRCYFPSASMGRRLGVEIDDDYPGDNQGHAQQGGCVQLLAVQQPGDQGDQDNACA